MNWWNKSAASPHRDRLREKLVQVLDDCAAMDLAGGDPCYVADQYWRRASEYLAQKADAATQERFDELITIWEDLLTHDYKELARKLEPRKE